MRELTQTSLHPRGNCWQTCVACILDLDPDEMPAQAEYDEVSIDANGKKVYGPSYSPVLNRYLREHHGLGYLELHVPEEALARLRLAPPGLHMLTGRTVRSDTQDGARHVVVGRYGEMIWDPHPSRAGLLEEIRWGLLIPFPESWRNHTLLMEPCACPRCTSRGLAR